MCKSFTCLLKCACVGATRKMINPQAFSQFLSVLECVLINSLRQVISETHSILKTRLPCCKQMEGKMLVLSNSGQLPGLFSPEAKSSWPPEHKRLHLLKLSLVLHGTVWRCQQFLQVTYQCLYGSGCVSWRMLCCCCGDGVSTVCCGHRCAPHHPQHWERSLFPASGNNVFLCPVLALCPQDLTREGSSKARVVKAYWLSWVYQ